MWLFPVKDYGGAILRYHKNKPFCGFVKARKREKNVFFFDFLNEIRLLMYFASRLSGIRPCISRIHDIAKNGMFPA